MKKMNNKGFSLVELIVVVLIMAIIAVALAPQVMKWVENSRKSTDIENYNALVEAANVASTNENFLQQIESGNDATITMDSTTVVACDTAAAKKALEDIMDETLPGWGNTKITGAWSGEKYDTPSGVSAGTYSSGGFVITISKTANGIKVEKTIAPRKNFS